MGFIRHGLGRQGMKMAPLRGPSCGMSLWSVSLVTRIKAKLRIFYGFGLTLDVLRQSANIGQRLLCLLSVSAGVVAHFLLDQPSE